MLFAKPHGIVLAVVLLSAGAHLRAETPQATASPPPLSLVGTAALTQAVDSGAAGDDYDEPVLRYGRAVDLAGSDIEPQGKRGPPVSGTIGQIPGRMPLAAARFTSGFGTRIHPLSGQLRFHTGIDMAAPYGTPVRATAAGRVARAGWGGGYGQMVAIAHGGAVETRYAHLSALAVKANDQVKEGQVIGYVGSTGNSTGPHLHYETRLAGQARNPAEGWRR